jgi:hypothetical protein
MKDLLFPNEPWCSCPVIFPRQGRTVYDCNDRHLACRLGTAGRLGVCALIDQALDFGIELPVVEQTEISGGSEASGSQAD